MDLIEYQLDLDNPDRFGDVFGHQFIAGPDGYIWFTERNKNRIGKIAPNGYMWFTEVAGRIGKIDLDGNIIEYDLPDPEAFPKCIIMGPDGYLWFTESTNRIGKIAPDGHIVEYEIPKSPKLIIAGLDGYLW